MSERLTDRTRQFGAIGVDMIFFALWAVIQLGLDRLLAGLNLTGFSEWVEISYQIIFAVSTVVPLALYTVRDIGIIFLRAKREIEAVRDEG